MKSVAVAVALVALAATAAAQPGVTPVTPPAEGELSEGRALALSLGGTVASWALVMASAKIDETSDGSDGGSMVGMIGGLGMFLAPSFGHWYRGTYFTRGMGIRLAGAGTAFVGLVTIFANTFGGGSEDGAALGVGLAIAGGGLFIGGTIDDIVQAPRQVRRHNRALRGLAVVPTVQRDGGGVVVSGSF